MTVGYLPPQCVVKLAGETLGFLWGSRNSKMF